MSDLERAVTEVLEEAGRRWPSLALEGTTFASYLQERLESGAEDTSLDQVRKVDLFLACACANGQAPAIAAFKEMHLSSVRTSLRALGAEPPVVESIIHRLLAELFTRSADAPAGITQYRGLSSLQAWLQVVATRMALLLFRRRRPKDMDRGPRESLEARVADPELSYLKVLYRDAFKSAFQEAALGLSCRERNLLRYRYLEGMSGGEIAGLYGVQEATAVRWLEQAGEALLEATRERLMANAAIDRRESDSFTKLVESQLDLSIRELFPREGS